MGSMVSLPNTSDTGPYFVCPSRAFTTAMDGDGIPPSCSASRRFCSVRLCTATSSFWPSTSTGALSANRTVFCTAALFSLLSPASCAILLLETFDPLLLESSDSMWALPKVSIFVCTRSTIS